MAQKAHEKRILKRRHLIYYLEIFNLPDLLLLGHMVDITSEGMMVIGPQPMQVGLTYQLRVSLPADIMGRSSMDIEATAVWSRPDLDPGIYGTGLRLAKVSIEDSRIIRRLIKDFGFQD